MVSTTSNFTSPLRTTSTKSTAPVSTQPTTTATTTAPATQTTTAQPTSTLSATTTVSTAPTAQDILKKAPFAPSDVNMFTPQVYSSAPALVPASKPKTLAELKSMICSIASKRFKGNTTLIKQALAVIDDPKLKAVVPDFRLRASLAMLKGTPGESAIDAIKNGNFKGVEFGPVLNDGTGFVVIKPGDTKGTIVINPRLQYEDPRTLGTLLAHESLHSDDPSSQKEELVAHSIESIIWGQMIKEDPALARSGTEMVRRENTKLMALLNSRDTNGNIRLTTSQGNVYPGGTELANFATAFGPLGADTPGNATMQAMLKRITNLPMTGANFSDATVSTLDQNIKYFSATDWVTIARSLKLTT